ncbi:hypothetical protein FRB96_006720 [Tulasnella sp. 330]|nr:hypothetical protein FRB96_006720 [Tulasnella sp. 330]
MAAPIPGPDQSQSFNENYPTDVKRYNPNNSYQSGAQTDGDMESHDAGSDRNDHQNGAYSPDHREENSSSQRKHKHSHRHKKHRKAKKPPYNQGYRPPVPLSSTSVSQQDVPTDPTPTVTSTPGPQCAVLEAQFISWKQQQIIQLVAKINPAERALISPSQSPIYPLLLSYNCIIPGGTNIDDSAEQSITPSTPPLPNPWGWGRIGTVFNRPLTPPGQTNPTSTSTSTSVSTPAPAPPMDCPSLEAAYSQAVFKKSVSALSPMHSLQQGASDAVTAARAALLDQGCSIPNNPVVAG